MAPRYTDPDFYDTPETDGGEARPRPLKARRLLEVMDGEPRKATDPAPVSKNSVGKHASGSASKSASERAPKPISTSASESAHESTPKPPARRASVALRGGAAAESEGIAAASVDASVFHAPPPAVTAPTDAVSILSVTPEGEGETVAVVLAVPASEVCRITGGKETAEDGAPARIKLHLLVEQYAALKPTVGAITLEKADALAEAGRLCAAIRRGMNLLGYSDPSARRLAYKLTAKGIDRETAAAAVAYLVDQGYIREDNAAALRAEQNSRKGWGPLRIREDLRAQGFSSEAAEEAMEALAEVDWTEACAEVIRKKYGEIPSDRGERQKLIAAMLRLGYDADTVREAMRVILRES